MYYLSCNGKNIIHLNVFIGVFTIQTLYSHLLNNSVFLMQHISDIQN